MKSKQLQKVAMILSCMSFSQGTAPDAYQLHLRFLQNNDSRTEHHVNLTQKQKADLMAWETEDKRQLNDDQIKLIESFLGGETEIRAINKQVVLTQTEKDEIRENGFSNELLTRLQADLDRSSLSGKPFNSLHEAHVYTGMQIEDGKLVVNSKLMLPFGLDKLDDSMIRIHIFEPGIKNNAYMNMSTRIHDPHIENHRYNDWEGVLNVLNRFVNPDDVHTVRNEPDYYKWRMDNLNQIQDLLHTLNFSRSLASQTNRDVDDIRLFLERLSSLNQPVSIRIIKNAQHQDYSMNFILARHNNPDTLIATLNFKDESDGAQWYEDLKQNPTHPTHDSLRYNKYQSDFLYRYNRLRIPAIRCILQSITLGSHTYEFQSTINLFDSLNPFDPSIPWMIWTSLKNHIAQVLYVDGDFDHIRMHELFNRINLRQAMRPIEGEFGID